ncbi:MAG: DUF1858 domain-containing protein [Candidatus Shapirobacteria bacterium]|jgi:hybrid cluster-associated redox disulfide protein
MKQKINKDILIADLVEKYPKLAKILVEDYNFHCIGCMAAGMESLEQGAMVHGMDEKQINKLVEELNKKIK